MKKQEKYSANELREVHAAVKCCRGGIKAFAESAGVSRPFASRMLNGRDTSLPLFNTALKYLEAHNKATTIN